MTFHWSNPYEFGGTQGETEKEYEFVSTIFAFISLELRDYKSEKKNLAWY